MSTRPDDNIIAKYDGESPMATELRRLYQNLRKPRDGKRHKSFLVTSAMRGEGKSTITSYLGLAIAHYPNQRVIVVDTDMRRPRGHHLFGADKSPGLFECLSENRDPMEVVQKTDLPSLDVITAGEATHAPSPLFEAELLSEFFEKIRFYYDIVLVDSPPVLGLSDTLFLCSEVEAVLYVLRAGMTSRDLVEQAIRVLEESNANILGVVVNNASDVLPYYHDYKYYGYEYKED